MGRPKKKIEADGAPPEVDLETRRRIIKAAETLFASKGYKGVSMKDLAEMVEVTAAALYYHFPKGKEDLFVAIIKSIFEEWAEAVPGVVAGGKDIRERLRLLTHYFFNRPNDNFPIMMRDLNENVKDEEIRHSVWKHYGRTYVQAVNSVFQQAIDAGEVTQSIPAHIMASFYQGMTLSAQQNMRMTGVKMDAVETERLAQMVVSVLLDGLGVRQSSSLAI